MEEKPKQSKNHTQNHAQAVTKKRDKVFWKVLNSALELDFRKGYLKWTMSELSRKSAITRSLIYYHFGRSKLSILHEAVNVIGSELIGVNDERMRMWTEGKWIDSMARTREVCAMAPSLCSFYLLHRERPTEIGEAMRKLEKAYIKKLETIFHTLPPEGIRAVSAFFFGITFSPQITDEAVVYAVKALQSLVGPTNTLRLPRR